MDKNEFERCAYEGYTSYGYSMSDGIYRPLSKEAFIRDMRSNAPLTTNDFFYGTDFCPTQEEIESYNQAICGEAKREENIPHHPECQCNECYYGEDAAKWLFNASEY